MDIIMGMNKAGARLDRWLTGFFGKIIAVFKKKLFRVERKTNYEVKEALNFYKSWSKKSLAKELIAAKIIIDNMCKKFNTGDPKNYLWMKEEK